MIKGKTVLIVSGLLLVSIYVISAVYVHRPIVGNVPKVSGANILISVVDNQGNPISNGTFVSEVSYAPPEDYLNYVAEVPLPETTDYLAYFTPPPLGSSATITVYIKDSDGMKTDKLIIDNSVYWENYERRAEDYVFEHIFTIGASEKRTILASIDLQPDLLSLTDRDGEIVAYIEVPKEYDINNINVSTISIDNVDHAEVAPVGVADHDKDQIPDLMVKFHRLQLKNLLEGAAENVSLILTGKFHDGTNFKGNDVIGIVK